MPACLRSSSSIEPAAIGQVRVGGFRRIEEERRRGGEEKDAGSTVKLASIIAVLPYLMVVHGGR